MTARVRLASMVFAMLAFAAGCSGGETASTAIASAIDAPLEVTAGMQVEVVVTASGGDIVVLEVSDAYVRTSLTAPVLDGQATFDLPQALTTLAGHIDVEVESAAGTLVASTEIVPDEAVDPIDIVVGPRTIVADGADQTMAVAFLTDRFGNPLVDGTGTTFTRRGEQGGGTDFDVEIDHGLAATLISASVQAERVDVVARVAGEVGRDVSLVSRRGDYLQVPGRAVGVAIEISDADMDRFVADGRTLVDVMTGVIVDVFGNQVPDGHIVQLDMSRAGGVGQLTSRTIDGRARFVVPSPDEPGQVSLRARVDDVVSDELLLRASPAVTDIPAVMSQRTDRTIVRLGPVLDHDGAIVADGTRASVRLETGATREVQLSGGRAIIEFEGKATVGSVSVTVLGVSVATEASQ